VYLINASETFELGCFVSGAARVAYYGVVTSEPILMGGESILRVG